MRKSVIVLLFVSATSGGFCQRNLKPMMKQIAAFKIYIGYVKQGYSIAKKGLNTIQDIKKGDFNIHNDYFNSKSTVNSHIRNYPKVGEIIALQISIVKQARKTIQSCRSGKQLTTVELNYIKQVLDNILDDCIKCLHHLSQLITDNDLEMRDDERIARIDKLYIDMHDKKMFVQVFGNGARTLSMQRLKDVNDIKIQKSLNGLR